MRKNIPVKRDDSSRLQNKLKNEDDIKTLLAKMTVYYIEHNKDLDKKTA